MFRHAPNAPQGNKLKKVNVDGTVRDYRPREPISEDKDTVCYHEASWQKVLGNRKVFDRVTICKDSDEENMEILNELKKFL